LKDSKTITTSADGLTQAIEYDSVSVVPPSALRTVTWVMERTALPLASAQLVVLLKPLALTLAVVREISASPIPFFEIVSVRL
ncbi:hypothetical protein ACC712_38200, partial [Rhizobium ruizarguesonis]